MEYCDQSCCWLEITVIASGASVAGRYRNSKSKLGEQVNENKATILIVDDEQSVRRLLSRKLSSDGYSCQEASDADQATELINKGSVGLMLLDINMPGKSGVELLAEIEAHHPDVAVLMVTGVTDISTAVHCVKAGAYDYLTKPFSLDEVSLSVERALEQRKLAAERKRLEHEAREINRLATIGEMAAGIAHEVNNPLAAIMNYADLVLESPIPEDVAELVDIIKRDVQRAAAILDRLLAFARQRSPELVNVDINGLLETTLALLAHQLEKHHIEVSTMLNPNLPRTVADASQLQQVFLNIVSNAETEMKLAGKGNMLLIKTEAVDNTIRISFTDNGPGIARENLTRIFDPFFTTRDVGQGSGLGLSVCHGIVGEHGGKIYAASELGKGATFIVELPIKKEASSQETAR